MRKYILYILLIGFIVPLYGQLPSEVRGIWLRSPETKSELVQAIDSLAYTGINTIFLETWYHSYTIYPSKVATQNPDFHSWDPLKTAITAARKHHMQVHAWMEVFYAANPSHLDGDLGPLLSKHPDWQVLSEDSTDQTAENGKLFLNPAHPEVRKYIYSIVQEISKDYRVEGINLDYIRYPVDPGDKAFGYDSLSVRLFKNATGLNVYDIQRSDSSQWRKFVGWKKSQVTAVVKEICDQVEEINPDLLVSAAVFPSYRIDPLRQTKAQDWARWVKGDMIDFLTPMCYSGSSEDRQAEIDESLRLSEIPVVVGLPINTIDSPEELAQFYRQGMTGKSRGVAWFAYNWKSPFFLRTLHTEIYGITGG